MRSLHYLVLLTPWLILVAVVFIGLMTNPDPRGFGTHEQLGFGACQFREWLNAPCPTCGVTTSVSHLTHGHPTESWQTQPLGIVLTLTALLAAPWTLRAHLKGTDLATLAAQNTRTLWTLSTLTILTCWYLSTR